MVKKTVSNPLMFFFIICFSVMLSPVYLPATDTSEYIIKTWTIEDGLPQNSVISLIQTSDGYIWFGTELGLVRFNGVELKIFNRWNTEGTNNQSMFL